LRGTGSGTWPLRSGPVFWRAARAASAERAAQAHRCIAADTFIREQTRALRRAGGLSWRAGGPRPQAPRYRRGWHAVRAGGRSTGAGGRGTCSGRRGAGAGPGTVSGVRSGCERAVRAHGPGWSRAGDGSYCHRGDLARRSTSEQGHPAELGWRGRCRSAGPAAAARPRTNADREWPTGARPAAAQAGSWLPPHGRPGYRGRGRGRGHGRRRSGRGDRRRGDRRCGHGSRGRGGEQAVGRRADRGRLRQRRQPCCDALVPTDGAAAKGPHG